MWNRHARRDALTVTNGRAHLVCPRCGRGAPTGQGINGSPYVWPERGSELWRVRACGTDAWVCEECRREMGR